MYKISIYLWLQIVCLTSVYGQSINYRTSNTSTREKEGQIRLVGSTHYQGNVEIYHLGRWGSICDDEWDEIEAKIVCKLLGFSNVIPIATANSRFGKAKKLIWMDNMYCSGNETSLNQCRFDGWKIHDCTSQEAAGVVCRPRLNRNFNRLSNLNKLADIRRIAHNASRSSGNIYHYFKPILISQVTIKGDYIMSTKGKVLIRLNNHTNWHYICGDGWSLTEAMVVCRQLKLGYGQFASSSPSQTIEANSKVLPSIQCKGYESGLNQCKIRLNEGRSSSCSRGRSNNVAIIACSKELPDLIPDEKEIEKSARLEDVPIYRLQCALEENCLSSNAYNYHQNDLGFLFESRRLLRFTAKIGNFGNADFRPFLDKLNWDWHSCHRHYHSMEVFAHFDVINGEGKRVAEGHKASFCLEDNNCLPGVKAKYSCDNFGDQGISVGCIDTYMNTIDCQWIDITDIPSGLYTLKISINPEFKVSEISFDNNAAVCWLYYDVVSAKVWNCTLTRP